MVIVQSHIHEMANQPSGVARHRSMQQKSMETSTLAVSKGSPDEVQGPTDVGEENPHAET